MTRISLALCLFVLLAASGVRAQCTATDFLAMPLPQAVRDPVQMALMLAYPDVVISDDGQSARVGNSAPVRFAALPGRSPQARLSDATVAEQFGDIYPLAFDLSPRKVPWFDPGRARNEAFFRALWFADRPAAESALVRVNEPRLGGVTFRVTAKRNVACQLAAALDAVALGGGDPAFVFAAPGGGFNWRMIAGTDRLSVHSFGIAVDINAELGQYWKWTGADEGRVGDYDNRIPPQVIHAFERFGFIWGGKWHHFDGMHFEFRPELVLHARLAARTGE